MPRKILVLGFCGIRNQNDLSSCTAMSATSIIEYYRNRAKGWYSKAQKTGKWISPRHSYYHSRRYEPFDYSTKPADRASGLSAPEGNVCPHHQATGHIIDVSMGISSSALRESLMNWGICDDAACEYKDNDKKRNRPFADFNQIDRAGIVYKGHYEGDWAKDPGISQADGKALFDEFVQSIDILPSDLDRIIDYIVNREFPVQIAIETPDTFHPLDGVKYYEGPVTPSGGGHAIVVVGYDKNYNVPGERRTEEAFLIRNSWGGDWGNHGYIWIKRETLQNLIFPHMIIFNPRQPFLPWPGVTPTPPTPAPGPGPTPPTPAPGPTPPTPPPLPPTPPGAQPFLYAWFLFNNSEVYNLCRARHISPRGGMGIPLSNGAANPPYPAPPNVDFTSQHPNDVFGGRILALGARHVSRDYWVWCFFNPATGQCDYGDCPAGAIFAGGGRGAPGQLPQGPQGPQGAQATQPGGQILTGLQPSDIDRIKSIGTIAEGYLKKVMKYAVDYNAKIALLNDFISVYNSNPDKAKKDMEEIRKIINDEMILDENAEKELEWIIKKSKEQIELVKQQKNKQVEIEMTAALNFFDVPHKFGSKMRNNLKAQIALFKEEIDAWKAKRDILPRLKDLLKEEERILTEMDKSAQGENQLLNALIEQIDNAIKAREEAEKSRIITSGSETTTITPSAGTAPAAGEQAAFVEKTVKVKFSDYKDAQSYFPWSIAISTAYLEEIKLDVSKGITIKIKDKEFRDVFSIKRDEIMLAFKHESIESIGMRDNEVRTCTMKKIKGSLFDLKIED